MTQKKRRPSLSEFAARSSDRQEARESTADEHAGDPGKVKSVHKSVYIPPPVLDQLDLLSIQERPGPGRKKKFNTLVLEGLDLLLKDRGLPSIADLTQDE